MNILEDKNSSPIDINRSQPERESIDTGHVEALMEQFDTLYTDPENAAYWMSEEDGSKTVRLAGIQTLRGEQYHTNTMVTIADGPVRQYRVRTTLYPHDKNAAPLTQQLDWSRDDPTARRTDSGSGYRDDPERADEQKALDHERSRLEEADRISRGKGDGPSLDGGPSRHIWQPGLRGVDDLERAWEALEGAELQLPANPRRFKGILRIAGVEKKSKEPVAIGRADRPRNPFNVYEPIISDRPPTVLRLPKPIPHSNKVDQK